MSLGVTNVVASQTTAPESFRVEHVVPGEGGPLASGGCDADFGGEGYVELALLGEDGHRVDGEVGRDEAEHSLGECEVELRSAARVDGTRP